MTDVTTTSKTEFNQSAKKAMHKLNGLLEKDPYEKQFKVILMEQL